jgi:S1-C subfamily serine protease
MSRVGASPHDGLTFRQEKRFMALAQPALLDALDQSLSSAVTAVAPSVLQLARGHGGGSALAWADDLAVTSSFHCPDQTEVLVAGKDGELEAREATVIGRDPGLDLALLRVEGGGLIAPQHREAGTLAVGNLAIAVGRPGRSARASMRMIGVLGKDVRTPGGGVLAPYIETDRQIPRGFAGGPLIDAQGRVIGLNTRTLLRGHDLAVSVETIARSVAQLLAHGSIPRGYLGVGVTPVALSKPLAALAGKSHGALVSSLDENGPAERAGLVQGDIIVSLAGVDILGPAELRQVVAEHPETELRAEVVRGGAVVSLAVTVGKRP